MEEMEEMEEMPYSDNCSDLTTFWDRHRRTCVPCERKPGHEVNPNCGRDDEGGIHQAVFRKCKPNTFNNGTSFYCQNCSLCPPGSSVLKLCTLTSDTICQERRNELTTVAFSKSADTLAATTSFSPAATTTTYNTAISQDKGSPQTTALCELHTLESPFFVAKMELKIFLLFFEGAVPIIIIFVILLAAAVCALKLKKRRGLLKSVCYKRRTSYKNEGFNPISTPGTNSEEVEDILNDKILSAPLHTVLDDLDVLEELVILLDPDIQGIKNTKHLASYCSFPSTWITYAYSMKESKSPLKAVLEGVTSKQPDWTVGHLANLLRQMDRNDAIAVLAKLQPSHFHYF
ncbi:IGF-like family receptor 1 isoform X2 [Girardinichthys multiradiatus]|uniref:IGF-like family receptor 1 isoform X2 n=1 Tax=Girardinichthys multiradiatus TaxID=208333 RepID=UPI001FAC4461|nr:IGF-like family receptor 1 isoform X2 [Girardinichthys multiradiatus]